MRTLLENPPLVAILLALIAGAPAYWAYRRGGQAEQNAQNIRVYTVYDQLFENLQGDAAVWRQRALEAEQQLRDCLNQVRTAPTTPTMPLRDSPSLPSNGKE